MKPSKSTTHAYTVEPFTIAHWTDDQLVLFLEKVAQETAKLYGDKFNWQKFKILEYAVDNRITICFRNYEPVGVMLARLYPSIFDDRIDILMQDLLFAKPGTRAAYHLMHDFIDFGKRNANHVITMTTPHSNIKQHSLEKLGFTKLEELYRMEN